jgi:hypothetical protein
MALVLELQFVYAFIHCDSKLLVKIRVSKRDWFHFELVQVSNADRPPFGGYASPFSRFRALLGDHPFHSSWIPSVVYILMTINSATDSFMFNLVGWTIGLFPCVKVWYPLEHNSGYRSYYFLSLNPDLLRYFSYIILKRLEMKSGYYRNWKKSNNLNWGTPAPLLFWR